MDGFLRPPPGHGGPIQGSRLTKLELTGPERLGGILDQATGEVALHTANHVVNAGLAAFADQAEGVILHDGGPADAAEQTLLHAALELDDGDLRGGLPGC
jgi:hypothetical protein